MLVIVKNNSQNLLSADCRPTNGQLSANSLCYVWGQSVGRLSAGQTKMIVSIYLSIASKLREKS